jgi:hypothetical protein
MGRYCVYCGNMLNEGTQCICQRTNVHPGRVNPRKDPQVYFSSLQSTLTSFHKNPVNVVCQNVDYGNWVAAAVVLAVAVIFQAFTTLIIQLKFSSYVHSGIFIKSFIIEALLLSVVILALCSFSRFFNQGNSNLQSIFILFGVSAIPYAAASIVTCLLSIVLFGLNETILTFAKVYTLLTALLAMKRIDGIKREETLLLIGASTAAVYMLCIFLVSIFV